MNTAITALTKQQIETLAPAAMFTAPTNPNLSKHYVFASTEDVINDMEKLGWNVIDAQQPIFRRHRASSIIRSYHMIVFRSTNPFYKISHTKSNGEHEDIYPEILLTNSHDGFSSFGFRIALYNANTNLRFIISTDSFNNVNIRHIGYSFEELQKLINTVMTELPNQITVMNKMQNRILTLDEKRALALAALRNRKNDDSFNVPDFILDEILENENGVDENLWDVFSTINYKMMEGCFTIQTKSGKIRKARRIKGIWKMIHHSQAMFAAAVKMI